MLEQIGGAILGLGLGQINDNRQYSQQQRLQALQMKGNREMMDYSQRLQLEMWDKTNYKAQIEQMKKAGLNPALLYGMGGGGGGITGDPSGNVTGATASQGGGGEIGMGLQASMMQSQIELAKTQAEKNKAEADSIRGIEGTIGSSQIGLNLQNIATGKAQENLTNIETRFKEIQTQFEGASYDDRLKMINFLAGTAQANLEKAENEAYISTATRNTAVEKIQTELTGLIIQNGLTESKIQLTQQEKESLAQKILQGWKELNLKGEANDIERIKAETDKSFKEWQKGHPTLGQTLGGAVESGKKLVTGVVEGAGELILGKGGGTVIQQMLKRILGL